MRERSGSHTATEYQFANWYSMERYNTLFPAFCRAGVTSSVRPSQATAVRHRLQTTLPAVCRAEGSAAPVKRRTAPLVWFPPIVRQFVQIVYKVSNVYLVYVVYKVYRILRRAGFAGRRRRWAISLVPPAGGTCLPFRFEPCRYPTNNGKK